MSELITLDGSKVVDIVEEDVKIKRVGLFEFVSSICETKNYILDNLTERDYSPFMINRALSQGVDTIMYANELNKSPGNSKVLHYDFMFYSISKKKRYNKWAKVANDDEENIKLLMTHYTVNRKVAMSYLSLLTTEQLNTIRQSYNTGGKGK